MINALVSFSHYSSRMLRILLVCLVAVWPCTGKPKNVLFLASDDMRPQLGAYYGKNFPTPVHPKMHTPNLDNLAAKSLLLRRAHTHVAVCAPSRTAILTGRRPDTTHIYDRSYYFRDVGGNFSTIPQYFKENGYQSIGMGKIFHPGYEASHNDDPISWTVPYWHAPAEANDSFWANFGHDHSHYAVPDSMMKEHGLLSDIQLADKAVETIKHLGSKKSDQPFFLAVGFHKPHLPFMAPDKYFDYYPEDSIRMPANYYAPVNMPDIAWCNYMEMEMVGYSDLKSYKLTGNINETMPPSLVKSLRRAYYAATTFTDDMIGRVLRQLNASGLAGDTVVSFFGDHGWALGENGEWTKHTNFEVSTHAPMMVHVPGVTDAGIQTDALSEFVDLFPTLAEAAGLPTIPLCKEDSSKTKVCSEGLSMMPLVKEPARAWKKAVFSQFRRNHGDVMGYSVRTDRYRYNEWPAFEQEPKYKPNWDKLFGIELYDHKTDPEENVNRANDHEYKDIAKELRTLLRKGWRAALPDDLYR